MAVIETRGLTKVYRTYRKESGLVGSIKGLVRRKYQETRAADDVTFQIEEGELVGFLGPNGAGKTTVLKMLSGLLNPTSGDARVARGRVQQTGKHFQHGGFPCAVWTKKSDKLAFFNLECYVVCGARFLIFAPNESFDRTDQAAFLAVGPIDLR